MARPNIDILLTPSRLEVAVVRAGKMRRGLGLPLDPSAWETAWDRNLEPLDQTLTLMLAELGVENAIARVFYRSPSSIAEMFTAPGHGRTALDAARLALNEACPFDVSTNPSAICHVHGWKSPAGRQSLMLMAADVDEVTSAITEWIDRTGSTLTACVPLEGALKTATVHEARRLSETGTVVSLRLGEHASSLISVTDGAIDFIRSVQLNIDLLVEALTRPIEPRGGNGTVELNADDACKLLFQCGVPDANATVDHDRAIMGYDILPALQPALQRCAVEGKQSVRFALDDGQRANATFRLIGPGRTIPNLETVLAGQIGLPVNPHPFESGYDAFSIGGVESDIMTAISQSPRDVNLMPVEITHERRRRTIRNAVAAGAVLAAMTGIGDGALTWSRLDRAHEQLAVVDESIETFEQLQSEISLVESWVEAINSVEAQVDRAIGEQPDWAATLREIATITPDHVRLLNMQATLDGEGVNTLELSGYITHHEDSNGDFAVTTYVRALASSPLITDVSLGATQVTFIEAGQAMHFQASLTVIGTPQPIAVQAEVTP